MPSLSPEERTELAARCSRSPSEFCRIFLEDWFPRKMPWVHRGILALRLRRTDFLLDFGPEQWRDETAEWTPQDLGKVLANFLEEGSGRPLFELVESPAGVFKVQFAEFVQRNLAIIMPRGFSKTTVMNAANVIDIVYNGEPFFLYVSETESHAVRQLASIKNQIGDENGNPNNPLIYEVFGGFQPTRSSPRKWTENYIETLTDCRIGALGTGGQIRGFSQNATRPGLIVFDDLQDEESVNTDTQRDKAAKWFFSGAMPSVRMHTGRVMVIGTLLHPTAAILNDCIKSREFTAVRFGAIDRQGDPLWEYMMSLEQIEAKKQAFIDVGKLNAFYLEYMSEWKDDKTQMFPASLLVYTPKGVENFVCMALAQDPAIAEEATKADFCTFSVVGMENGGRKHVVDFYGEQGMDPADQVDKFFELHFKWLTRLPAEYRRHGIESIAFQRALISLVQAKQFEMSQTFGVDAYFEIEPIMHGRQGKMARVQGILKPLLRARYLTFETQWPTLHNQFIDWPSGKLDGPDCVAMAVKLLDPFVALNLSLPEQTPDQLHNPLVPLETMIGGNFRTAP